MPFYQFNCTDCSCDFEKSLKIAERDENQTCTSCESKNTVRGVSSAPFVDPVRLGVTRPDSGFREVLQRIHERNPGSILKQNSKYI